MIIKSELVNNDWGRIYIDETLVLENHRITARGLMGLLSEHGIQVEYTEVTEDD